MEYNDLYDKNKVATGETIKNGENIPYNRYILVVMAIIQNRQGDFLIQKRSDKKGGKWSITGGHPKTGESSMDGLIREIKEELGVDVSENPIFLKETLINKQIICDSYHIISNIEIDQLVLQKEEVSEVRWASASDIETLIRMNEFYNGHVGFLEKFL